MMLHDELVNHLDPNENEADANIFERLWGGNKEKKEEPQESKPEESGKSPQDKREDRRDDRQDRREDRKDERLDRG